MEKAVYSLILGLKMKTNDMFYSIIDGINIHRNNIRMFIRAQVGKYKTKEHTALLKDFAIEMDNYNGSEWDDRFDMIENKYIKSSQSVKNVFVAMRGYIDQQRDGIKDVLVKHMDLKDSDNQEYLVKGIAMVMDEDEGMYWDDLFNQVGEGFNVEERK